MLSALVNSVLQTLACFIALCHSLPDVHHLQNVKCSDCKWLAVCMQASPG